MKRMVASLGISLLGFALIILVACQEKTPTGQGQAATPQPKKSQMTQRSSYPKLDPAAQSKPQEMELAGILMRSADGFLIITDSGDYSIAGQPLTKNLNELVDKRVKVTATLVEGAERQDGTHVIKIIELSRVE